MGKNSIARRSRTIRRTPSGRQPVMSTIKAVANLAELAEHVGANDPTEKSIGRRLYKDTECGITFAHFPPTMNHCGFITVWGYAEGSDVDLPGYTLYFPFATKDFDELVQKADDDGKFAWDEANSEIYWEPYE